MCAITAIRFNLNEVRNMESKAAAIWSGGINEGHGNLSSDSQPLNGIPICPSLRGDISEATNPEELLAAAHASCFSLTLAMILGKRNLPASRIDTQAVVTLDKSDSGLTISKVHLEVRAIVPTATPEQFVDAAKQAEEICPISKLINAEVSLDALLMDIG